MKRSQREVQKARRQAQKRKTTLLWGGLGVIVVGIVGFLVWTAVRPAAGIAIAELPADHIEEGLEPGPYNSNPPTSGSHYSTPLPAGFYESADLDEYGPYPLGYLVHSLEHGYVVFWYNCDLVSTAECEPMKDEIKTVMDDFGGTKLIAFPWEALESPVVMTSWARMQSFDNFTTNSAARFVRSNRNRAPEPNAQ
jgi:hypothetical protein